MNKEDRVVDNNASKPTTDRDNSSMPRQISGAEFNYKLRDPQNNQAHTESFIRDGVVNVDLPGYVIPKGYRLVKSLKKEQYRLLSTDGIPETVYLLELRFRTDIIFGETTCTQIKVWRTVSHLHQTNIGDLPRIFFIHLLDSHSIMVTDEEHTRDGQRFWEIMISWAFHQDYYIYASDGTIEDRPLTQIQNEAEFFSQWVNQLWGTDIDVYTHKLVVISKHPLL
ncbi:hypothetical protein [Providencia rustigianii]|uniref:hypothetical protein n=1 Tax=Providencia rustigianii TaxID=158850 RepID=UPI0039058001